jgi:hypothetical protein
MVAAPNFNAWFLTAVISMPSWVDCSMAGRIWSRYDCSASSRAGAGERADMAALTARTMTVADTPSSSHRRPRQRVGRLARAIVNTA